jgi:hypothetical protein
VCVGYGLWSGWRVFLLCEELPGVAGMPRSRRTGRDGGGATRGTTAVSWCLLVGREGARGLGVVCTRAREWRRMAVITPEGIRLCFQAFIVASTFLAALTLSDKTSAVWPPRPLPPEGYDGWKEARKQQVAAMVAAGRRGSGANGGSSTPRQSPASVTPPNTSTTARVHQHIRQVGRGARVGGAGGLPFGG